MIKRCCENKTIFTLFLTLNNNKQTIYYITFHEYDDVEIRIKLLLSLIIIVGIMLVGLSFQYLLFSELDSLNGKN